MLVSFQDLIKCTYVWYMHVCANVYMRACFGVRASMMAAENVHFNILRLTMTVW